MPILRFPIPVYLPQLEGFHWQDLANLLIAITAISSLIVTIYKIREQRDFNEAELKQMETTSQRQYEMIVFHARLENRIRVYAPMLGYLRARMEELERKSPSLVIDESFVGKEDEISNLGNLKASVETFEFRAELELLGSTKVLASVDKWMAKLRDAYDELEDLQSLRTESMSAEMDSAEARKSHIAKLIDANHHWRTTKKSLREDLDLLKMSILAEFDMGL